MTFDERVAALAPLGFTPWRHRPERHVSGTPGGLHKIGTTRHTYRTAARLARLSTWRNGAPESPGRLYRARDRGDARHHGTRSTAIIVSISFCSGFVSTLANV